MDPWVRNSIFGLIVAGCLIGSHVMVIVLASLFETIIEDEPECMHNVVIDFDSHWSDAMYLISYIGIGIVIVSYIISMATKNWIPCLLVIACTYGALIIANGCITYFYIMTYLNNWFYNEDCSSEEDVAYVYEMLIGSYFLLMVGIGGFVCCFIAWHRH